MTRALDQISGTILLTVVKMNYYMPGSPSHERYLRRIYSLASELEAHPGWIDYQVSQQAMEAISAP